MQKIQISANLLSKQAEQYTLGGGKGFAKTLEEPAYGTPHHLKYTNIITNNSQFNFR